MERGSRFQRSIASVEVPGPRRPNARGESTRTSTTRSRTSAHRRFTHTSAAPTQREDRIWSAWLSRYLAHCRRELNGRDLAAPASSTDRARLRHLSRDTGPEMLASRSERDAQRLGLRLRQDGDRAEHRPAEFASRRRVDRLSFDNYRSNDQETDAESTKCEISAVLPIPASATNQYRETVAGPGARKKLSSCRSS